MSKLVVQKLSKVMDTFTHIVRVNTQRTGIWAHLRINMRDLYAPLEPTLRLINVFIWVS